MEVKINKEIRNYTETVFFGLSLRQFIFSAAACGVAVILYFLLRNRFGVETVSWICVLDALPMALFGFVRYHGMYLEGFIWAWIRSEVLMPSRLLFGNTNIYYQAFQPLIEKLRRPTEEPAICPGPYHFDIPAQLIDPDGSMPTTRLSDKSQKSKRGGA
ncbi:MAG: PrgI family protein [Firmicutes bacterium]|nr:PrgI family protein [Bacillota bacterium]